MSQRRDGSVRLFQGPDFTPAGGIGSATMPTTRAIPGASRIVVGYGKGASR